MGNRKEQSEYRCKTDQAIPPKTAATSSTWRQSRRMKGRRSARLRPMASLPTRTTLRETRRRECAKVAPGKNALPANTLKVVSSSSSRPNAEAKPLVRTTELPANASNSNSNRQPDKPLENRMSRISSSRTTLPHLNKKWPPTRNK